jgi:hypothetical protein
MVGSLPFQPCHSYDTAIKPAKDRGKIFNDALLRAVGHKDAPPEVKDAFRTEDVTSWRSSTSSSQSSTTRIGRGRASEGLQGRAAVRDPLA